MFFEDLHIIIGFVVAVVILLVLDLKFIGKPHEIKFKEAAIWTAVFILASVAFAGFIYIDVGEQKAVEFLTAYTIEKILSVDNLFVFILIFKYFKVPSVLHHKVLFYGIIGAVIFRAIFIFAGVELISLTEITIRGLSFNILILLFGLFLLRAGIKSAKESLKENDTEDESFENSLGSRLIKKLFKIDNVYTEDKFFVRKYVNGKYILHGSLLLVVVGVIEFSDLLFAVDSIPAILSISKDPFILYTSNIFAILGLRSMYFLLANLLPMFKYLGFGVAVILAFIGVKMVISPIYHIESLLSLIIVCGILCISIGLSLTSKREGDV